VDELATRDGRCAGRFTDDGDRSCWSLSGRPTVSHKRFETYGTDRGAGSAKVAQLNHSPLQPSSFPCLAIVP
jgi:hypothetical protein